MAKIGELLGLGNNPLYQAFSSNRGAISGAFGGMAANPMNPWAGFAHGGQVGGQLDLQTAEAQRQEQEQATAKNSTLEWLRSRGYDDLVAGVEGGGLDMGTAWGEALRRSQPQDPNYTAEQRNWLFAQENPDFAQFLGGSADAPQIVEIFDEATGQPVKGYMQGTNFVPVGGSKQPSARDNPMNATIQKEIFDADDAVLAGQSVVNSLNQALILNDQAWTGPAADGGSWLASLTGNEGAVATQDLKNLVTAQALDQLKAVFGGMPTEGERKILLEIQGSVSQSPENRRRIYERAIAAANRRIEANKAKADGLRSGSYFDPGFGQQPAANVTSTGLQWSIEP